MRFLVAGSILAGLGVGLAVGGGVVFLPEIGAWAVRSRVVPRVERELGRTLAVGDVEVTHGRLVLHDVVVSGAEDAGDAPLARVAHVSAEFDFWDTLRGRVRVGHVVVEGLRGHVVRHADGRDNVRDLVARLRQRMGGTQAGGAAPDTSSGVSLRPSSLALRDASFEIVDAPGGVSVTVAGMSASLAAGGSVEAELHNVAVRTDLGPGAAVGLARITTDVSAPLERAVVRIENGSVVATRGVTLSSVAGTVAPEGGTALRLDLAGSYGGATEPLWTARGRIDLVAQTASIDVEADQFTFDRLDSVLRDSAVVDYDQTSLSAAMHVDVDPARVVFDGRFRLEGLSVFHPMLATKPVEDMDLAGEVEGQFDRATRTLTVTRGALTAGELAFRIDGFLSLPGGLEPGGALSEVPGSGAPGAPRTEVRRQQPRLAAHLVVPPVPCQSMLDAVPSAMIPYLEGFSLRGTFEADVRTAIDWANLEATQLDGKVDIFGCRAREQGEDPIAERLLGSFMHYVEVERDVWLSFVIGPENPDFVPIAEVSPFILKAFMTTEDSRFYDHDGFIPREFRSALVKNLEAGYFMFGASSITMQTVKNVLLYREKTLARKLQELFFTWYIETQLEKDRIFEIYVNAIEYGPGLYGIGPATRHYFGKHPFDVGPVEAAFLASLLPSPKPRYKQYCDDKLSRTSEIKIQRILTYMHERGRLTDEEYEAARVTPLVFDRAEAGPARECKRMVRRAIENARPTNPMLK
jgi:Transglycosylase